MGPFLKQAIRNVVTLVLGIIVAGLFIAVVAEIEDINKVAAAISLVSGGLLVILVSTVLYLIDMHKLDQKFKQGEE